MLKNLGVILEEMILRSPSENGKLTISQGEKILEDWTYLPNVFLTELALHYDATPMGNGIFEIRSGDIIIKLEPDKFFKGGGDGG